MIGSRRFKNAQKRRNSDAGSTGNISLAKKISRLFTRNHDSAGDRSIENGDSANLRPTDFAFDPIETFETSRGLFSQNQSAVCSRSGSITYFPGHAKTDTASMMKFLLKRLLFVIVFVLLILGIIQVCSMIHTYATSPGPTSISMKGYSHFAREPQSKESFIQNINIQKTMNQPLDTKQLEGSECKIAIVTSFPPEKCGIAQFSTHLLKAMDSRLPLCHSHFNRTCSTHVIVLHDHTRATFFRNYDSEKVDYVIDLDDNLPSKHIYAASKYINDNGFTHVLLQNEYGLTPIMWQQLDFLRWISPSVKLFATIHSPRMYPTNEEREFLYQMGHLCERLIVMSQQAKLTLSSIYSVPEDRVTWIPHGVLPVYLSNEPFDKTLNSTSTTSMSADWAMNKKIIFSNGLIHNQKGYDRLIRVLPELVREHPDVLFLIVGQEHAKHGWHGSIMEEYIGLAETLGVRDHIKWIDSYVTDEDLANYMSLADIYITLYDEITPVSGTLMTAMACGKAILSTPYNFAQEMLSFGDDIRGIVLDHYDDAAELTAKLSMLLASPEKRETFGAAAREFVSSYSWSDIGARYLSEILDVNIDVKPVSGRIRRLVEDVRQVVMAPREKRRAFWHHTVARTMFGKLVFNEKDELAFQSEIAELYGSVISYQDYSALKHAAEKSEDLEMMQSSILRETFYGESGTFVMCLLADSDIQINATIGDDFTLKSIGIRGLFGWIYCHEIYGLDVEFLDETEFMAKKQVTINWATQSVFITSRDFEISIKATVPIKGKRHLYLDMISNGNICHPKGLFGSDLAQVEAMSKFKTAPATKQKFWSHWQDCLIKDAYIFSTYTKGQQFEMYGIHGNIFKASRFEDLVFSRKDIALFEKAHSAHEYRKHFTSIIEQPPVILFQLEGSIFDHTGFSHVNRQMFFHLLKTQLSEKVKVLMKIVPSEFEIQKDFNIVPDKIIKLLAYENYRNPYYDISLPDCPNGSFRQAPTYSLSFGAAHFTEYRWHCDECVVDARRTSPSAAPDLVFRNNWLHDGPDLSEPVHAHTKWIHQQPWEFYAHPVAWSESFNERVDALWVPSAYCRDGYVENGIKADKIAVVSHGIDFQKLQSLTRNMTRSTVPNKFTAERPMRILFAGGMLARKGYDVLAEAFLAEFKPEEHVTLFLSSTYGANVDVDRINGIIARNEASPAPLSISFKYQHLAESDVLSQFCSRADLYVSPYRSEGFGLMILEVMALGVPVAVPRFGPAVEFSDASCAFYIDPQRKGSLLEKNAFNMTFSDSHLEACTEYPCGDRSMFGKAASGQPRWSTPSIDSLRAILRQVYEHPELLAKKHLNGPLVASRYEWARIVRTEVYPRLFNMSLVDEPVPARIRHQRAESSFWKRLFSFS